MFSEIVYDQSENIIQEKSIPFAYGFDIPLMAASKVCFSKRDDFDAHCLLIFFVQGKPSMTLNLKFHLQNFILNLLMR
jgi:DNA polymerase III alpha subunit